MVRRVGSLYALFYHLAWAGAPCSHHTLWEVRLGSSGLKVSRIILGTMQYGNSSWQKWVLEEEEAIEHIKYA